MTFTITSIRSIPNWYILAQKSIILNEVIVDVEDDLASKQQISKSSWNLTL